MEILSQMSFLSFHQLNMFIQKHNTKFEDHVGDITSLCVSLCVCTRVCLQVCVMCMEVRGHLPCHSLGTVYLLLEGPSLARVFTKGTRPANRECQLFRLYLLSHCHDGTKLGFLCGLFMWGSGDQMQVFMLPRQERHRPSHLPSPLEVTANHSC